ncbi:hypothetical protein ACOMHN_030195 [Nucella lapillus]
MMIKIVVALCVLLHLSAGDMSPCNTDADCDADQCCVRSVFAGKDRRRFILDDLLHPTNRGQCKALGQLGQSCVSESVHLDPQTSFFGCPCAQGFECHGEEKHYGGVHIYINHTCTAAGTYTAEASKTGTGNPSGNGSTTSQ